MQETRIYERHDGWLHKEVYWHGASETVLISSTVKKDGVLRPFRRWRPYKPDAITEEQSWLSLALERARDNGDL